MRERTRGSPRVREKELLKIHLRFLFYFVLKLYAFEKMLNLWLKENVEEKADFGRR